MDIREDLFYTESHEWVKFEDDTTAVIGLSDFAQSELGDLVFVNLPEEGDEVAIGDTIADVESVKAVSDVFAPVGGTVAAINEELLDAPEKINEAPYEAWLCKIEGIEDRTGLISAAEYKELIAK